MTKQRYFTMLFALVMLSATMGIVIWSISGSQTSAGDEPTPTYSVRFLSNSGGAEITTRSVEQGTYVASIAPTNVNEYLPMSTAISTFQSTGWATDRYQTEGTMTSTDRITNNITYYLAVRETMNTVKVDFVINNVVVKSMDVLYAADYDMTAELPAVPACSPEFRFDFWYWKIDGTRVDIINKMFFTRDTTITAHLAAVEFNNVKYYNGDALVGTAFARNGYEGAAFTGDEPAKAPDAMYTYAFAGWDFYEWLAADATGDKTKVMKARFTATPM